MLHYNEKLSDLKNVMKGRNEILCDICIKKINHSLCNSVFHIPLLQQKFMAVYAIDVLTSFFIFNYKHQVNKIKHSRIIMLTINNCKRLKLHADITLENDLVSNYLYTYIS